MTTNPQTAPLAADREQQIRDVVRDLRGWAGAPSTWTRMLHDVLAEVDRLRAVSVPAPAPTDQTALRDRIAEALHAQMPGCTHDGHGSDCRALADAVLAVLPANQTTDRAAIEVERDSLGRETDRLRKDWLEMRDRAEKAEAALGRVRRLHDRLTADTDLASPDDRITRRDAAERIATALDHAAVSGPGRVADETQAPVHVGGGANAEDCPACHGTNPPYPFICPGPNAEAPS